METRPTARRARATVLAGALALVPSVFLVTGCTGSSQPPSKAPSRSTATGPEPTTRAPVVGEAFTVRYPDAGSPPFPTVVMIHGGGFTTGDRDDPHLEVVAARFREEGYATASVDYRLGTEIERDLRRYAEERGAPYSCDQRLEATGAEPALDLGGPGRPCLLFLRVIERADADVRAALVELHEEGPPLGLDVSRLAMYGESAGSTLAIGVAADPGSSGVVAVVGAASGGQVPAGAKTDVASLLVSYDDARAEMPNQQDLDQVRILEENAAALRRAGGTSSLLLLKGRGHLPEQGTADLDELISRSVSLFRAAGVGRD